jgi:molybdate transport system substrate-binding protein
MITPACSRGGVTAGRHGTRRRGLRAKLAALCLLLAGAVAAAPAQAVEIRVAAASSLARAMEDIGREFESAHEARVRFDFATSDSLLAQLANGGPADVFVADADDVMDRAEALMLAGTRRDVAADRLVVVVAAGAPPIATLAELAMPRIERIAVGTPQTSAVGRYAQRALDRAQLWTPLALKFLYVADAPQVRDAVVRGEAAAGFVYETEANGVDARVRIAFAVPTAGPVRYSAAVVRASTEEEASRAFVRFLRSAPAAAAFTRHGFRF